MRQNYPPEELVKSLWYLRISFLTSGNGHTMCSTSTAAAMGMYESQGASGSSRPQQHFDEVHHVMMISTPWHASIWADLGVTSHRGELPCKCKSASMQTHGRP